MQPLAALAAWGNFYVIVGSAAAALIGLQFVATVLGSEIRVKGASHVTSAFGTPTVVHLSAALLNAAILSAPWPTLSSASVVIAVFGVGGMLYTLLVLWHARRQTAYVPVLEDWIWHTVMPVLGYAALVAGAILLPRAPARTLFAIGAAAALLLLIGIHNAWDSLTYIAVRRREGDDGSSGTG